MERRLVEWIGVEIGMNQLKVGEWRKRFFADGLEGLVDKARLVRPRRLRPRGTWANMAPSLRETNRGPQS